MNIPLLFNAFWSQRSTEYSLDPWYVAWYLVDSQQGTWLLTKWRNVWAYAKTVRKQVYKQIPEDRINKYQKTTSPLSFSAWAWDAEWREASIASHRPAVLVSSQKENFGQHQISSSPPVTESAPWSFTSCRKTSKRALLSSLAAKGGFLH